MGVRERTVLLQLPRINNKLLNSGLFRILHTKHINQYQIEEKLPPMPINHTRATPNFGRFQRLLMLLKLGTKTFPEGVFWTNCDFYSGAFQIRLIRTELLLHQKRFQLLPSFQSVFMLHLESFEESPGAPPSPVLVIN
jgi:hypothetical protein